MGNSSQHKFTAVPEVTYGTTPATPAMQVYGITGTTLALSKNIIESETINPNRQLMDVRHGMRQVGGDVTVEMAYGAFDLWLQAVLCGTWAADVLVPGTTRRSFSVMRNFTDLGGGALPFHTFVGVEFNTLSLSIAPDAMVKATFGCIGKNWAMAGTAPVGTTYPDVSSATPFDSFTGSISIDGVAVATVTEITLTVENGMEPRFVVFQDTTNQTKAGKTRVTGQLTLYFESADLLTAFNGEVKKNLSFTLTDKDGNDYTFDLPAVLPTGGQVDVSGDADVTIPWPFTATYVTGAGTPDALKITRIPA